MEAGPQDRVNIFTKRRLFCFVPQMDFIYGPAQKRVTSFDVARTVGVSQSGVVTMRSDNSFYSLAIQRLAVSLAERAYSPLLFISTGASSDELLLESLKYQVDGIILLSTMLSSPLAEMCEKSDVPIVLVNRLSMHGNVSSVTTNNYGGGRKVGAYLLETGHKKIAFIAGQKDTSTSQVQEPGLVDLLKEHSVKLYAKGLGNYSYMDTQKAVRVLSERHPDGYALIP